jgi:hypothetical protein
MSGRALAAALGVGTLPARALAETALAEGALAEGSRRSHAPTMQMAATQAERAFRISAKHNLDSR